MKIYQDIYKYWQHQSSGFWATAAQDIAWSVPPKTVFNEESGVYGRWFEDGECNTCYNCIDRHVENGNGEKTHLSMTARLRRRSTITAIINSLTKSRHWRQPYKILASRKATALLFTCQ